jgi:hypothetical protein
MATIPQVQEAQIEGRVGRRGLRRGWDYFQSGAIFNARRQGSTLKAFCTGSSVSAYRVQVTFDHHNVIEADCSCPVGRGGYCKHVAALLVCWRERPQEFTNVEELDASLGRCSRRELADLIKDLVDLHPELEDAIEAKLPSPGVPHVPPDPKTYRRQAAALLERAGPAGGIDTKRLAEQLTAIKEIGDAFARQREPASAAVVYLAVLCELLGQAGVLAEREPPVADVIDGCVEALGRCLADLREESEARAVILRTLLGLYRFDLASLGTARTDVAETILTRANVREKRLLAEWIEEMLPGADSRATRRALGGLLLEIDPDHLDHEAFCRICRASERWFDLAWRLIGIGRMDQAVEEARQADNYDFLKLADLLVRHGQALLAEGLVQERCDATGEHVLQQWLTKRRTEGRNQQSALELEERIFRLQPGFEGYGRLRRLARRLGAWDGIQPQLLLFLQQTGRTALLVRIHLDENDVDRALGLLASIPADEGNGVLELEVARATERSRPAEALQLYRGYVERLIAGRGRENYAEACRLLRKVRALMKRTGAARAWTGYLAEFRERYRALRALQEELDAADL